MRDRLAIVFVCLLALSVPAMVVDAASADGPVPDRDRSTSESISHADRGAPVANEPTAAASTTDTIDQSTVLHHRPADADTFGAVVTTSLPEPVSGLEVEVSAGATIESADGFVVVDDSTLRWDGDTDEPTATLRVEADRRQQEGGHTGRVGRADERAAQLLESDEDLDFAATDEWGIVAVPQLSLSWEYERGHSIAVERATRVAGEGAVGETIGVFGPVEEHVAEADGETHRLVVPEAADLAESPDAILAALGGASEKLTVGAPNDEFFVVAAPTGAVDWRADGLQYGDDDAWVRADARLDEPRNVWLHEYTHSRQPFAGVGDGTTAATRWLVEGQADYYAATLALDLGYVEYRDYRRFLERGTRYPYDEGVLAEPDTWADAETPYTRGPLALLAIDRDIRRATGGDLTLQSAFRRVNGARQPVELSELYGAVEAVGGADAGATAERVVETESIPDTRTEDEHRSLFDVEPTAFTHDGTDDPVDVSGPYRNGSVDGLDEVVPGETVRLPATVENVDTASGYYDATLAVDGEIVDASAGSLAAGERTTERLAWTPETPGTYALRVGDDRRSVTVAPAVEATVTALRLSDRSVDPGDSVTATATVAGHPTRPAAADVAIRTPNGVVADETVHLGPGETTTVEATFTLDDTGRNQVTAGDQKTVVGVGSVAGYVVAAESTVRSVSATSIAGGTAIVAALSGALVARRRGVW